MKGLTVFGDSVMKGVEYMNHKYILSNERFQLQNAEYHNKSKLGCTSERGFEIIKKDLPTLDKGSVALIEYGGNDSDFDWQAISETPDEEHLPKVSVDKFERTLNEMVELVRSREIEPVLMTLPPVDPYRYFDFVSNERDGENILKWLGRKEVIYSFQEQYSLAVLRTALKQETKLIDVRAEFLKKRNFFPYISDDGIHPSSEGHRLIANTLEGFFSENIIAG